MPAKDPEKEKAHQAAFKANNPNYWTEWRAKNPGYYAKYRAKNLERLREYAKSFYANNARARAIQSAWAKANPDKVKEYAAAHRARNRDKYKDRNAKRRTNTTAGLSPGIIAKLFKLQKGKCPICKSDLRKTGFHVDHIVPLIPRKGEPAGKHEDRNIQLACPKCNMKKHNKNPIQFMQEQGYLL
ncbi:HNH endonuclease [Patescibacteria group bacterium]|jgi:5-methylcytosine-specific restriction endonuclease McrA|nr:HNH endonuclease [Patescibacteria group bacterium]